MMPTARKLAVLIALSLSLVGCDRHIVDYRYRLTVEIMTPQGLRKGTGVIQVGMGIKGVSPGTGIPYFNRLEYGWRGQAIEVRLDKTKSVFAVLGNNPAGLFQDHLGEYGSEEYDEGIDELEKALKSRDRRCTYLSPEIRSALRVKRGHKGIGCEHDLGVSGDSLRKFVFLRDRDNPKSLEQFYYEDFEEKFGPGVKLWRVIVEPSADEVTLDLDKRLPWIKKPFCKDEWGYDARLTCGVGWWQTAEMAPHLRASK